MFHMTFTQEIRQIFITEGRSIVSFLSHFTVVRSITALPLLVLTSAEKGIQLPLEKVNKLIFASHCNQKKRLLASLLDYKQLIHDWPFLWHSSQAQ